MQQLKSINPETAEGKSKELFDTIKKKLGMVPNMMKVMGNSPSVLNGYLSFSNALSQSSIGGKLAELIALTVANNNDCAYCTRAHTFISANILKLDHEAISLAREGRSSNHKIQAALIFSKELIRRNGKVSGEYLEDLRGEGFSEGEITEIIAHTALNMFTNFINNVSEVDIDFPEIELQDPRVYEVS